MIANRIVATAAGVTVGGPGRAVRWDGLLTTGAEYLTAVVDGGLGLPMQLQPGVVYPVRFERTIQLTGMGQTDVIFVAVAQDDLEANVLDPVLKTEVAVTVAYPAPTHAVLVAFDPWSGLIFNTLSLLAGASVANVSALYAAGYVLKASWFDSSYGFTFGSFERTT